MVDGYVGSRRTKQKLWTMNLECPRCYRGQREPEPSPVYTVSPKLYEYHNMIMCL